MISYFRLVRPLNLLIVAVTMYLFRLCIVAASPYKLFNVEPVLSNLEFFILVLATLSIAAGGYVINDIFDVDIDSVNRPKKVILGVSVSEMAAYNFYKILCLLGIVSTLALAFLTGSYRLSALPVIMMVMLNFYAHTFKKQLIVGNFIVALSAAFTIWLIALFETASEEGQTDMQSQVQSGIAIAAIVYGGFAFLTTFLREVIKDMEDREGDEQYGCRTIAVVFGEKGTKLTAYIISLLIALLLASFVWFFPSVQVKKQSFFVFFGLILPLIGIIFFIFRAKSAESYHFVSNLIKFFMCLGIASMLYFRSGIGPYIFVQYANFIKKLF